MRKFLAVVKHEYRKIVLKWTFLLSTLLLPFIAACFVVVPTLMFAIKSEPMRIVIVDPSGKIAPRIKQNLSADKMKEKAEAAMKESLKNFNASSDERLKQNAKNFEESYILSDYDASGKSYEQFRADLNEKVIKKELDAYLIIPENFEAENAKIEFYSRKAGDFVTEGSLEEAVNEAIRTQRFADARVSEQQLKEFSRKIDFDKKTIDERGEEKNSSSVIGGAFVIGLLIYITLAIYGQMIMGAVVEEKETRIAEILFSSAKPFELMMGKLVGVGLAGLTQLAIWISTVLLLIGFVAIYSPAGFGDYIPNITLLMIVYFFIYFLLGFFIYASIFALIGSMVTTVQEGGQFSFPPIMLLLIGFYFTFLVIRDPNSTISFWVSIAPFFAPITMPVRIMAEMPPYWQIALSIFINAAAIAGLIWLASRVYRVGMLMYGKRATIPEVWKWIKQT